MIAITMKDLKELISAPEQVAKDLMDARERLLKLEYKYKELIDVLTDLRAHQIMNAGEALGAWNTPDIEPEEGAYVIIYKNKSAASGMYTSGNYYVYNPRTDQREVREYIEYWIYAPDVTNRAESSNDNI